MIKCNCCGRENSNYAIYCDGCGSLLTTVSDSTDVMTDPSEGNSEEPSKDNDTNSAEYTAPQDAYQAEPVKNNEYTAPDHTYDPNPRFTSGTEFDSLCIAGFICSLSGLFCCGLPSAVGLILCIVGLVRAKSSGKKGAGLAVAGIILAIVLLAISIMILVSGNSSSFTYYSSGRRR